ncbi:MAG: DUF4352 domain-containing protein [Actinobacteria bacterium]|nr:DUF4352 domain-containing protein [Actinomycetota bacterium]
MNKKPLSVFIALLILFVVAGCGGETTTTAEPVTTAATAAATVTTATAAPTTATTTKPALDGSRENPIPVGTSAKVGDWEVTVTDVSFDAWAALQEANQFNDPPADGSQYVMVTLEATYNGDESGTFWVDASMAFLGAGGNTFDSASVVEPNPIFDAGEAFAGATVSGDQVYEVPSDQISGGRLIIEPTFSFDKEDRVFFAIEAV